MNNDPLEFQVNDNDRFSRNCLLFFKKKKI